MRFSSVVALFPDLPETELVSWVERGWVRPEGTEPDWIFADIVVARRSQMRAIARAMERQPEAVRDAILAAIRG